ncbi:MAG TPA: helix-turn-helix domain-containing protein [Acidimicrobiales bacterium]|nr:helix-turn-helix domain-containing protein [Acidimicrobiales bacterium]
MVRPVDDDEDTRGIVRAEAGFEHFRLSRHDPSPELAWAVDRCWIVRWDLVGREPYEQRIVPHPAVHLVFEGGKVEIEAISRHEFVRRLEGRGQVLGIKFRPAGFRPFLGRAVSTITDQRLPATAVPAFADAGAGAALDDLARRIHEADDVDALAADVDRFLVGRGVAPLPMTGVVDSIVEHIQQDRSIVRVDDLARRLGTSTRRLQRLFADHVGLGPKWVINRSRVLEAAELAAGAGAGAADAPVDWAALAADLGYSDQAHLVRDFTANVGTPPDRYARGG